MAKSLMPIWKSPLPNKPSNGRSSPQNPQGCVERPQPGSGSHGKSSRQGNPESPRSRSSADPRPSVQNHPGSLQSTPLVNATQRQSPAQRRGLGSPSQRNSPHKQSSAQRNQGNLHSPQPTNSSNNVNHPSTQRHRGGLQTHLHLQNSSGQSLKPSSCHESTRSPLGDQMRASGAHAQRTERHIDNRCACAAKATNEKHARRETDENRRNERSRKNRKGGGLIIKPRAREQPPLSIEEMVAAKYHMDDKLAKINKWECPKNASNVYYCPSTEPEYAAINNVQNV